MQRPRTADAARADLERLREKLADGRLNTQQFAHLSARLIAEIARLEKARQRIALT